MIQRKESLHGIARIVIYKILVLHGKQGTENYMKFAFQIIINGIPYLFLL